jgi:ankyrin repeat protein
MSDSQAPSDLSEQELAFCEASIRDWHGRAARMLAANPEIAGYGLATALVLGDAPRVREAITRDPAVATRPDVRTGWTPLHVACASRWHRLDPARAPGLVEVARLLLDAGADPVGRTRGPRSDWTPLRCAVAGAANPDIVRLLLDQGAVPDDHDLYLACFGDDDRQSLRLLLGHAPDVSETTALSAPISTGDIEAVRMLLDAGANPNQPMPAELFGTGHGTAETWPAAYAAVQFGCDSELLDLLLARGADPNAAGPDGRSPYRVAISQGRADLAAVLRRHGARDDATAAEHFLSACLRGDQAGARQLIAEDPGLVDRLSEDERGAIELAAERGDTEAVRLMLDLGFPLDARHGDHGSTPLHAAAYAGSAETVRLLLARGADIEARDITWDSTPLEWAKVGSGLRPQTSPQPDWAATVRILLDAGASTESFELAPDDLKPASDEVAEILRAAGVRG